MFQAQGTVTKTPSGENGLPAQIDFEAVKCCIQENYQQRLSQAEATLGMKVTLRLWLN